MITKVLPLMVLGMGAQSYYNKTKEGKALAKKVAQKKLEKSNKKCPKCEGKGCSHCGGDGYHE